MLRLLEANGYAITVTILLISTLASGIELACVRGLYLDLVFPDTTRTHKRAFWRGLHLLQACLAVATWIALQSGPTASFRALFVVLGTVVAISYRLRSAGKDGSDQVRLLSFLAYAAGFLLPGQSSERVPMYFMGVQILIAYGTAGIVKAFSPHWQGGRAVSRILSVYSYGWPRVGRFLQDRPWLDRVCSYSPIAIMLFVPVAFVLPFHLPLLVALGLMLGFHLTAAVVMGLNDFVITFPSAYPGVILLHGWAMQWLLH